MSWNSDEIKQLRQRCGWSIAELARHLGCHTDTVKNFEAGNEQPDPEVCQTMENILSYVENNATETINRARAEQQLKGRGCDQIHTDELDREK